MSYLAKPERKALILSAAIEMTLKEGLESLTARSVTMHAGISTGQIYHHYQSISELRAEVFKTISSQYFQESLKTGLNAYDLLIFMLLPDESEDIR
ncbi:TetR family transcriptional regulator, partial [Vibrio parahaemolyticus]|nr:TetR family transcriptional regulator [Vibrio parahaemolyticus]